MNKTKIMVGKFVWEDEGNYGHAVFEDSTGDQMKMAGSQLNAIIESGVYRESF